METHNRLVINDCEPQSFENFIARLKTNDELELKKYKPAGDGVFQERYSYTSSYEHISIVYETKSKTLIITAADHILLLLKAEFAFAKDAAPIKHLAPIKENKQPVKKKKEKKTIKSAPIAETIAGSPAKEGNPAEAVPVKAKNTPIPEPIKPPQSKDNKPAEVVPSSAKPASLGQTKTKLRSAKENKPAKNQPAIAKETASDAAKENTPLAKENNPAPAEADKGGYTIKKISPDKFEDILRQIKALKGVSCQLDGDGAGGKSYTVRDQKNKAYLRYFPTRKSLQLQGKKSPLLSGVQGLIQGNDYIAAVSSYIELTGEEKKARELEKMLKKQLPVSFDFLSEQSRIDLTIGMMDIGNDEVRLSDYSTLLVPPYRGLERLIFDLQQAQDLNVKMIGQAYEKTDGKYVLKAGYRKRVGSIVYAEVMSALYIEYFEKRNFYAHSDITGDRLSRVITDKETVKAIFKNLIELIEYNVKKLKEIGFTL